MKNISLQMTDTTSIKNATGTVNKNNASIDGSASVENNASFQMMLNKQVQAKHASTQDAQSKQAQAQNNIAKKTSAKEPELATAKPKTVDVSETQKMAQNASHLQLAMTAISHTKTLKDAETTDINEIASKEMIDHIKSKSLKTSDLDTKSKDDSIDTNDNSLTSVAPAPEILSPVVLDNKLAAQSISNPNSALASSSEALSEKQRSLGTEIRESVLNKALSQGKNSNLSEAQDITAGDDKPSKNSWVEAMLPNTSAKQMSGDDTSKLMLNAAKEGASKEFLSKEFLSKETAIKEVAMPANFQSTTQMSAAEAMKQVGSSNSINAYPGKTGWDQAISQKVVWMLGAQEQSATLTLNPPDLGPLQVVINVRNDQANTTFISDNAEVRQALQDGMDNLRNKMNESGIQLGQANVSSGGQMQQQFQQAAQQSGANASSSKNHSVTATEQVKSSKTIISISDGLVDTFA